MPYRQGDYCHGHHCNASETITHVSLNKDLESLRVTFLGGLIRPFKGLIRPVKGLIRPFEGLIRPLRAV